MTTLSLCARVRNAAAVFSGGYGAVARRAREAGCSRQTVYDHARRVERSLGSAEAAPPAAAAPAPGPGRGSALDGPARRRLAVTAFAMGLSTRQIEDLIRVIQPDDCPDHATVARWVAAAAGKAGGVLAALDAACAPAARVLALDEIFFGGGRPWSGSSRRA